MATHTLKGVYGTAIAAATAGDSWKLVKTALVTSAGNGFDVTGDDITLNIAGHVSGQTGGIYGTAVDWTVNIAATGAVYGGVPNPPAFDTAAIKAVGSATFTASIDGIVHGYTNGISSSAAATEINLGKGASVGGRSVGILSVGGTSFSASIDGHVFGGERSVVVDVSGSTTLGLGRHGHIQGGFYAAAVELSAGGDATVTNAGAIKSLDSALTVESATHISITNSVTGRIVASDIAIGTSGASADIVNHGSIVASAQGNAISCDAADDSVLNDGKITGNIGLGGGDDLIDTRGGIVRGLILGEAGNDTLMTDDAGYVLTELANGGTDTVKSTVTYALTDNVEHLVLLGKKAINATGNALDNALDGNKGANTLTGLAGADALWGGKGNDRMFGGDGADSFYFSTGDGKDKVMDFDDATFDALHLEGWTAFTDLDDLKTFATDVGDNLVITVGKDSLTILGIHEADLDAINIFL